MLMIYDWGTNKYLTLTGKGGLAPVNYQEFGTVWPESQYAKLVARWEERFPTLRVLYTGRALRRSEVGNFRSHHLSLLTSIT